MRAHVNGSEFFIREAGSGERPALILGHSLATSHEMWGLQLPLFARHFRVISFDMRGHGASAAPSGGYSLDQLADDVVGIADHLGVGRFHFLGLSIGGMIGQVLGLRHGGRIQRLVLSSTLSGSLGEEGRRMWDDRIATVLARGAASQVEGTMARWLSPAFQQASPHTAQWIRDLIAATPAEGYAGCGAAIRAMNFPPARLGEIGNPTLVIAGECDPGATPAEAARIAAAIPGARSAVVSGGYHLCNIEFPHAFSELALDFLLGRADG